MNVLFIFFIVIFILDVILFLALLVRKGQTDIKHTVDEIISEKVEKFVENQIEGQSTAFSKLEKVLLYGFKKKIIEELVYQKRLGVEDETLNKLLDRFGFIQVFEKSLKSRKWWKKLEVLHYISLFRISDLKSDSKRLLDDRDPFVQAKAFRVLTTIGQVEDLEDMLKLIDQYKNERYRQNLIVRLLGAMEIKDDEQSFQKIRDLHDSSESVLTKIVLLQLMAKTFGKSHMPFFQEALGITLPEDQITIIKGLAQGEVFPKAELRHLLSSSSGSVEIICLKALAQLGDPDDTDLFVEVLHESSGWWQQYYAAFGLAILGDDGIFQLEKAARSEGEPSVKQFANYFLQILNEEVYVWESLKKSLREF